MGLPVFKYLDANIDLKLNIELNIKINAKFCTCLCLCSRFWHRQRAGAVLVGNLSKTATGSIKSQCQPEQDEIPK